jgi:nicotinate-nucleotide adenylyltransferase
MQSLAIYGGTFDPIHNAHIATALRINTFFHFNAFYFLPCKDPLNKAPSSATASQRVTMLQLALKDYPDFHIDLREVHRNGPSYMVETLHSLRSENPKAAITLIVGFDAFLSLPKWHQWQTLIGLANIVVIDRSGIDKTSISPILVEFLADHETKNYSDILHYSFGKIVRFDAGQFNLSSTAIRHNIQHGKPVEAELAAEVIAYIKKYELYK